MWDAQNAPLCYLQAFLLNKEGALPLLLGKGLKAADQSLVLSASFDRGRAPVCIWWTHQQQQHA